MVNDNAKVWVFGDKIYEMTPEHFARSASTTRKKMNATPILPRF